MLPCVIETKASESEKKRPLYWSEAMDVELGKLVKDCVFDFDLISARMVSLAERNGLAEAPEAVRNRPAEVLTAEQCRLRWAQLVNTST